MTSKRSGSADYVNTYPRVVPELSAADRAGLQQDNVIPLSDYERAEKLRRDLDVRINELETHLYHLTTAVNQSKLEFGKSLEDIEGRQTLSGEEIQRLTERFDATLGQQLNFIEALDSSHAQLSEAQNQLDKIAARQGQDIESLAKLSHRRLEANKAQLDELSQLHAGQQKSLQALVFDHRALVKSTAVLGDRVAGLEVNVAEDQRRVHRRLGWQLTGLVAAVLLTVLATVYFQLYPTTVPASVQAQLADLEQVKLRLAEMESLLGNVKSQTAGIGENLAGIQAQLSGLAATDSGFSGTMAQLDEALRAVNAQVDDLAFKVDGPTNTGAGLIEPLQPIQGKEWTAAQNPDHYTIQLVGVFSQRDMVRYVNRNAGSLTDHPLAFNQGKLGTRDWYNLFYGNFATLDEANLALESLPLRLQTNSPYLRPFSSIQR